jgi:hypothetical protein
MSDNKGSVFYKACREIHRPDELSRFPIGQGRSPFGVNVLQRKGRFKKILDRGKFLRMSEGEYFTERHEKSRFMLAIG